MSEEDAITAAVLEHWKTLGVPGSLVAGIPNKRAFGQVGLTPGMPDLMVFSPFLGERTGFIEIKGKRGRLSPDQRIIRAMLTDLGVPCAVTFGRDEPIEILRKWGAVRA
jgi:hypothetical protein